MAKVSVVIPIYNASKYLSLCLDSIVSQTYKKLEIILVDDKSTDNSLVLLKEYKEKCRKIKIIRLKENGGVSHARNAGIEKATGDYIFFIDSDDFVDKNCIKKLVEASIKYDADVIDTERLYWYRRGAKLLTFTERKKLKRDLILGNMNDDSRCISMPRYVTGKLYKRSVIGDIRFDENVRCYEDALFNHQIKTNINKYVYLKDTFYNYLQRPYSLINTISTNHMDYLYVGKKINDIYKKESDRVKQVSNNVILDDIIAIIALKIPKMLITNLSKYEHVSEYLKLIDSLSIKKMKLKTRIAISIFKKRKRYYRYLSLVQKINLVDRSFVFLNMVNSYKIKDEKLKKKVGAFC